MFNNKNNKSTTKYKVTNNIDLTKQANNVPANGRTEHAQPKNKTS